jgi:radical SAM superfamily enzyme YgiQ (UPF0313 family)
MQVKPIKKIIFIEPKSPGFHVYSMVQLPRLGTILLGTMLKERGYDVKIFVEEIKGINFAEVFEADAVGISTITSTAPRAYEIARQIKKLGIPVFMGGPHVTFLPDEALNYCDYVLRGETEETIFDFIRALETGQGFETVKGLSYHKDQQHIHNEKAPHCLDLDRYPVPDFSLIHGYGETRISCRVTPIMTSRGCPFACNFCAVTEMFGRRYRFRSTESVLEEIKAKKPRWIFFYDDNFAANKEHTKEFLRRKIDAGITTPYGAQVRIDVAKDEELLDLLRRSNCDILYIGFESINPKTLDSLHKNQTKEEIEYAIEALHRHNIKIHGMFIVGAEHDDISTIRETVKFTKKMKLETVQFMMLIPLPGTSVFKTMNDEDRIICRDWSYYDGHHVVFRPKKMSFFDLQTETVKAYVRFYSLPRILKCLNRFDLWTMATRAFGRRVTRKWRRNNREFMENLKQLYHQAGESLSNAGKGIHSAGVKLELRAKKTAEDIKEMIRHAKASKTSFQG